MNIDWYNIKVLPKSEGCSSLSEKVNKSGQYARRKDVEPLIRRMYKQQRETKDSLKHLRYMIETFRSEFSKEDNERMVRNCNMMLSKIDGMH